MEARFQDEERTLPTFPHGKRPEPSQKNDRLIAHEAVPRQGLGGWLCPRWLRLARFLIVRDDAKGEMRMEAHFWPLSARRHLKGRPVNLHDSTTALLENAQPWPVGKAIPQAPADTAPTATPSQSPCRHDPNGNPIPKPLPIRPQRQLRPLPHPCSLPTFNMPNPCRFQGSPRSVQVNNSRFRHSSLVIPGSSCISSAAAPETTGVAMDVPLFAR